MFVEWGHDRQQRWLLVKSNVCFLCEKVKWPQPCWRTRGNLGWRFCWKRWQSHQCWLMRGIFYGRSFFAALARNPLVESLAPHLNLFGRVWVCLGLPGAVDTYCYVLARFSLSRSVGVARIYCPSYVFVTCVCSSSRLSYMHAYRIKDLGAEKKKAKADKLQFRWRGYGKQAESVRKDSPHLQNGVPVLVSWLWGLLRNLM